MKAVEDHLRVRRGLGDGRLEGVRHVDRDRLDLRRSLGSELGKEAQDGRRVLAGRYPHDAAAVVGHDGDVLVVAAVAELVDADPLQAGEAVCRPEPPHDALEDQPDGLPGDRHHRRDRRLVGPLGEVRDDLLERMREPRAGRRPRHHLGRHAAARAVDAPRLVLERDPETADVEVPHFRFRRS